MINRECRIAGIGCVDCKKIFANNLNENLEPFREKREQIGQDPKKVFDILHDGENRAKKIAKETMREVRSAVGLP